MTTWIGADWDSEKCVVAFEKDGKQKKARVMRHPKSVAEFMGNLKSADVVVGIEGGDPLWARLWELAGARVFVFDPKKAKNFSSSLRSSGASDDRRSAQDLQHMVQSTAHRAESTQETPQETRGLERLLRTQETTRHELLRSINRVRSLLKQVHPCFALHKLSLKTRWVLSVLMAAPTPRAWPPGV